MRRKDTVMKNTKSIIAFTLVMVIIISALAACSAGADETAAENTRSESTSVSTTAENTTAQSTEVSITHDSNSGSATTTSKRGNNSETTAAKKRETTTKETTTKKKDTTTKKQNTTEKKTTTTVKHVSPKDVQNQVNNYIKSKGWSIATDFTPSNSSWMGQITAIQETLDSGRSLELCKEYVDAAISDGANKQWGMCCYYNSSENCFYILYSY